MMAAAMAADLPTGLSSPDHGVLCNGARGICFDRFGPSIGLTEAFLGKVAADRLTATLKEQPADHAPGTVFSPAPRVECVRETGPCRVDGEIHNGVGAVLYGAWPGGVNRSAETLAVIGVEWQWMGTRYNDGTEARPADPARYRLRLEPDGTLRIRADCNEAGGQYRMEESTIAIEITHSTLAACEPGSLERVFLKDLSAAGIYFLREGRLYLDFRYNTGTMEFGH